MRVVMTDLLTLRHKNPAGVGHYTQELVRALREIGGEEAVVSYQPPTWVGWAELIVFNRCKRFEMLAKRPGVLALVEKKLLGKSLALVFARLPWLRTPMKSSIGATGAAVYHEPNFIPLPSDLPTVTTVHDLSVLLHPEWHPPRRVAAFEKNFQLGLSRTDHLVAISEFGRRQIIDSLGWPADRVSVTYMGVRPDLRRVEGEAQTEALHQLGLAPGYLLHVGTLEPRKNLLLLMRAYCALPSDIRDRHPLVLVGGGGWMAEDAHAYLRDHAQARNVRWLGYARSEQVAALYSGARALLFPTLYEGFGMPTIEMMACGGAVIASTAGAVAETAGGQAHLLDPRDEAGWRDAMQRICLDDDWHDELCHGAEEHARQYTWRRCAEASLEVYRRVVATGRTAKAA